MKNMNNQELDVWCSSLEKAIGIWLCSTNLHYTIPGSGIQVYNRRPGSTLRIDAELTFDEIRALAAMLPKE